MGVMQLLMSTDIVRILWIRETYKVCSFEDQYNINRDSHSNMTANTILICAGGHINLQLAWNFTPHLH